VQYIHGIYHIIPKINNRVRGKNDSDKFCTAKQQRNSAHILTILNA